MPVTHYIWDELSDNVLQETDETGATAAEYTCEPDQFGSVLSQRRDSHTYTHHYDATGSTRQLTDESGTVTDTYDYDAWGEEIASSGTTENPYRFCGKHGYYTAVDTNDIYVRARAYVPSIARWISADPLAFVESPNVYTYGMNSPVDSVDPSGLACCCERIEVTNKGNAHFDFGDQRGGGTVLGPKAGKRPMARYYMNYRFKVCVTINGLPQDCSYSQRLTGIRWSRFGIRLWKNHDDTLVGLKVFVPGQLWWIETSAGALWTGPFPPSTYDTYKVCWQDAPGFREFPASTLPLGQCMAFTAGCRDESGWYGYGFSFGQRLRIIKGKTEFTTRDANLPGAVDVSDLSVNSSTPFVGHTDKRVCPFTDK